MTAYAFYRFECALRSAAVLGFFGFPTLGSLPRSSRSRASYYGEVWTYLYLTFLAGRSCWTCGAARCAGGVVA